MYPDKTGVTLKCPKEYEAVSTGTESIDLLTVLISY